MNTLLAPASTTAHGTAPLTRSINADVVARTLAAKAQQRPLIRATAPQAYVALPDGSLVRREEWVRTEADNYRSF